MVARSMKFFHGVKTFASGVVKMNRNAVGERPKPKSGLRAYFEPQKTSLKGISCLSGKPLRQLPRLSSF